MIVRTVLGGITALLFGIGAAGCTNHETREFVNFVPPNEPATEIKATIKQKPPVSHNKQLNDLLSYEHSDHFEELHDQGKYKQLISDAQKVIKAGLDSIEKYYIQKGESKDIAIDSATKTLARMHASVARGYFGSICVAGTESEMQQIARYGQESALEAKTIIMTLKNANGEPRERVRMKIYDSLARTTFEQAINQYCGTN